MIPDRYVEGFGVYPCQVCGHGDCQCKKEDDEMKQDRESFKERIRYCKKCGHVWLKRIEEVLQCPNCKTARWDKKPLK